MKKLVEVAADEMAVMFMNPSKPKDKPWRMIPVGEFVQRVLPLCEFARFCEASPDKELAARAHKALEALLSQEMACPNCGCAPDSNGDCECDS